MSDEAKVLVGMLEALACDCDAGEGNQWEDYEWRDAASQIRQAADRIEALTAAGDALAGFAGHGPCMSNHAGLVPPFSNTCDCGLSEALAKWADAKGAT